MELKHIKYLGGPHHIALLCKDKDTNQLYVCYGRTAEPQFTVTRDTLFAETIAITTSEDAKIIIPFVTINNSLFHLIAVDSKKDLNLINTILETLLED